MNISIIISINNIYYQKKSKSNQKLYKFAPNKKGKLHLTLKQVFFCPKMEVSQKNRPCP